jgi:hypothetical protein
MTPSNASAPRKVGGEAFTGGMQAWKLSSEITCSRCRPSWATGKAIRSAAKTRVASPTCGVIDPAHVCKLFARKPGDPRSDRLSSTIGPVEEGLWP